MKIIVDAMGGDNAPLEIVKGALYAVKARPELEIILVGREEEVRAALEKNGFQVLETGRSEGWFSYLCK